jgi:hypothetical protein
MLSSHKGLLLLMLGLVFAQFLSKVVESSFGGSMLAHSIVPRGTITIHFWAREGPYDTIVKGLASFPRSNAVQYLRSCC